ncbi:type IV secretion system DNA-binding domain-containing protein [Patescibacteria group bacterium]|nr:type IV secretion system DNA-binding domain-containing protein [Patescibacteria group bacterium]MBU1673121.1 type IV secretion system DNA-binding domain-containing protein [Patescibacteria group bacterium]MBU1963799.1 type IV secretion system DNA-binding domain-containing protein [Patescibacteria group bacterium]
MQEKNQNQRKTLLIKFPLVSSMEDYLSKFQGLFHNIYFLLLREKNPDNIMSCEIVAVQNKINFYFTTTNKLTEAVMNSFFSLFPDIEVLHVEKFLNVENIPGHAFGFNMKLEQEEKFSLRTYKMSEPVDPLSSFLNMLASVPAGDAVFYQIVFQPINEEIGGEKSGLFYAEKKQIGEVLEIPKFHAAMRCIYFFPDGKERVAREKFGEVMKSFDEFSTEKNQIVFQETEDIQSFLSNYLNRKYEKGTVLSEEELASLFHIPDPAQKMQAIDWILSKRAQPPFNLPTPQNCLPNEASFFARTNFRGSNKLFGIKYEDRRRHLYIIGKSGTGKSKLLEGLITDDIKMNKGVVVLDPHGDLIQNIIKFIPEHRMKDVIYFNTTDLEYPVPFNPLAGVEIDMKQQMTQGFIEVFKKFFGADWSPKIEHVFRYTTLALLDYKNATIVGMMKMLTNRKYRQMVIPEIQDSVVKHFWANEFSSWSEKFDNEAILPLVNRLGQFLSNHIIRNVVAQPENKIDFDSVIKGKKVLLIEMSRGRLGEENNALLGAMLITRIYQTAMAQAKLPETERQNCYMYIDEFQNFATETFENILSESRKYKLNLTLSHQYLGQVPEDIKSTVFGNVGSMISFRVGADDGTFLSNEYHPIFNVDDFINLGVREILVKISVEGHVTPPFSAMTKTIAEKPKVDNSQKVIDYCRKKYATPKAEVDKIIANLYSTDEDTHKIGEEEEFEQPIV